MTVLETIFETVLEIDHSQGLPIDRMQLDPPTSTTAPLRAHRKPPRNRIRPRAMA
jgi:hypothetical protein